MLVSEWMSHPVHTVKPRDTAFHARQRLEEQRINQLPVVAGEALVGIVTDRDLRDAFPSVFEMAAHGTKHVDPDHVTVESIMSSNLITLSPTDTLEHAAQLMRKQRVGALPVLDKGKLVGILCRSDMMEAFVELAGRSSAGSSAARR
jgi:acetoin utilization protein AcuB